MTEINVALQVSSVTLKYGRATAARDVSLQVKQGSIASLVGNNGAGKTSVLHAIMGLVRISAGSIEVFGVTKTGNRPAGMVKAGVALVPEGRHVIPSLTARDNLLLGFRDDSTDTPEDRVMVIIQTFPELKEHLDRFAGHLSGGQQQMVAIGRALMSNPKLLLLDEPGLGLSPPLVQRVFTTLEHLSRGGLSILIAEQLARVAFSVSETGYIMGLGSIVASGSPDELTSSGALEFAYFARSSGA